jgi:hypothetical protein
MTVDKMCLCKMTIYHPLVLSANTIFMIKLKLKHRACSPRCLSYKTFTATIYKEPTITDSLTHTATHHTPTKDVMTVGEMSVDIMTCDLGIWLISYEATFIEIDEMTINKMSVGEISSNIMPYFSWVCLMSYAEIFTIKGYLDRQNDCI